MWGTVLHNPLHMACPYLRGQVVRSPMLDNWLATVRKSNGHYKVLQGDLYRTANIISDRVARRSRCDQLPERRTDRHSSRVFLSGAPVDVLTETFCRRLADRCILKPNRGLQRGLGKEESIERRIERRNRLKILVWNAWTIHWINIHWISSEYPIGIAILLILPILSILSILSNKEVNWIAVRLTFSEVQSKHI